jgi:hypothetical protein
MYDEAWLAEGVMRLLARSVLILLLATPVLARAELVVHVELQPSSDWAVAGSGIGPVCDMPPSPGETDWAASANDGVTLGVVGTDIFCCDCIRRSAYYALGLSIPISGTHLTGTFVGQDAGRYAAASFRVILLSGTEILAHKVFSDQQRGNNNCAGTSEEPEIQVPSGAVFDIDLATLSTRATFDGFEIEVLGYACPDGSGVTAAATAILSAVDLHLNDVDAGPAMVAPVPSPGVTDPFANGPDALPDAGTGTGATGKSTGCAVATGSPARFPGIVVGAVFLLAVRRRRARRQA